MIKKFLIHVAGYKLVIFDFFIIFYWVNESKTLIITCYIVLFVLPMMIGDES